MITELTNHLFQSTLFGIAAAFLTLAFRKNQAQVRALHEQLGLKFVAATGPGESLVIDHVERPTDN
jgi:uncharacterized protein (TIGR03435 family)